MDEGDQRRRQRLAEERLRSLVRERDRTGAIDDDDALDETREHDRQEISLALELSDMRLDLAGHHHHRPREHPDLATGGGCRLRWRDVVLALRETLGGRGHRLDRPRDRANEDPRQQEREQEAQPEADEQPIAHALAGPDDLAERHREPDHAPVLGWYGDEILRRPVGAELADGVADLVVMRLLDLERFADRAADGLRIARIALDEAILADDRESRTCDRAELPRELVGRPLGREPSRHGVALIGQPLVERRDQIACECALDHVQRAAADDDEQRQEQREQPIAERRAHALDALPIR